VSDRRPLALVVAIAKGRVIGKDGGLPWHIPEDLRHFRRVTMGHAILMGRKTWDSIGRALPGRRNIVITRNRGLKLEGADVVHSLEEAVALAREEGDSEPRVIGGASLYEAALPLATRIYLTEVDLEVEGDTFFPELEQSRWRETDRREQEKLSFLVLERNP
jgi:dihydrofolate reductase